MVGRELTQLFPKDNTPTDRVALSVKDLSLTGTFSDVSFDVRAGEIFGIAGLVGSKRTEVAETIFGLRRATSGEILIDGVPVDIDSPAAAIDRGMAFLTEDRKISGLFLPLSVQENMEVTALERRFVTVGFVRQTKLLDGVPRGGRPPAREDAGPVRARSDTSAAATSRRCWSAAGC